MDAPPSGDGPGGAAFTGVVDQLVNLARTPLAGATVTLTRDDGTQVGTTVSDADGKFSIAITGTLPIDGFYKVTGAGVVDSFSHLVLPASTDPGGHILAMSLTELMNLAEAAGTQQAANAALVIAEVRVGGAPQAGATVQMDLAGAPPLPVCYSSTTAAGLPSCAATSTASDGLAWTFSVPPGELTVTGTDAGGGPIPGPTFEVLRNTVVFTPVRR